MHIDGYNLLPYLTGEEEKSPRKGIVYFSDDGDCLAIRAGNWKVVFMEQRAPGTLRIWAEPFTAAAGTQAVQPADRSLRAGRHHLEHLLRLDDPPGLPDLLRNAITANFLESFNEFPPRQKPATFSIDQAVERLNQLVASD